MARGRKAEVGEERVSANGYHYVRTETGWRLKHHLIAEKKLSRKLKPEERVSFRNGKRNDLNPENIVISIKGETSKGRRIAQLEARIEELKAELDLLRDS